MSKQAVRRTELDLVEAILRGVNDVWNGARVAREVRTHGRARADLLLELGGEVTAIEAKLRHWKRAVAQAALNRYCADRSYFALWAERVNDDMLAEALQHGLGVLAVHDDGIEILVEAPVAQPSQELKARFLRALNGGDA